MPVNGQYRDSESQDNTPILKIRDVPEKYWIDAVRISKRFLSEYPERMGFSNFVVYLPDGVGTSMIVYRTKTSVVVRGNIK